MIDHISTSIPPLHNAGEGNKPLSGNRGAAEKAEFKPPENAGAASELSEEQQKQVDELKKRDQEVRAHEAAHKNAGGQYAGSASYTYTVGPDGKRYATGGEVPIDVAPVEGDPEATVAKLDVVIAAALAPAKPSAQDRQVAAAAVAARNKARAELAAKEKEELSGEGDVKEPFDVNDFGSTPQASVNKAYEGGLNLGQEVPNTSGVNFSEVS
ncbi:putative metalloprotease CJM1_0395 family protein [Pseudemcibacter aquimaris]|uniref:putative metalloprotease CJM1_0395 family protein n=1 Tax=Pseudemcibacter aquimaris TaxID=2857064 RepID=UPI00201101BE|nr:putative metalloprotease CJM1_0395 family protein [Pseudemcibacter aquimaris]MCC3860069.1 hypothetical protein [Pseudemcibacter aquimaris]WDU57398.1 hypothetical protein KW060_09325 [Pseudemcibacter aquimaris]